MWQFAESPVSIAVLESFYNTGKPIARVCHSLGGFRHATYQGAPPRCLLSVDTGIVPSSVSVTSAEVIPVRIGRWNQGLPQLSNQIED